MKLTKPFKGVPDGEIYPVEYQPGDECPKELEAGALSLGALGDDEGGGAPTSKTVAEIKALLDAAGIAYPATAKKDDLLALLPAA
ncbi:HeH/LEM domain-containing protein [Variovorax boronicumulans]|uniref:HeH/LEM domain-containing protein n=1 Tax=Variovorax boronicumulans TaxID=436515 RepID=UPI00214C52ED